MSFEIIVPLVRPIAPYLHAPDMSEIILGPISAEFIEPRDRPKAMAAARVYQCSLHVAVRDMSRLLENTVCEEPRNLDVRRLRSCGLRAGVEALCAVVRQQSWEAAHVVTLVPKRSERGLAGELHHVRRFIPDEDREEVAPDDAEAWRSRGPQ